MESSLDPVFKAMADRTRRQLLERLEAEDGQSLGELCKHLGMSRQAATKHIAILESAKLVVPVWSGREKRLFVNRTPIDALVDRIARRPAPLPKTNGRPVKLIVQIPCYNEEDTLPVVVRSIPRRFDQVDRVEILVIDDGSTDGTAALARELGVDHVISHTKNKGLARSFRTGLDASLALGADIIVNTDGDNQYDARDIDRLIRPILDGTADIVVGDRQTQRVGHFSPLKRRLQSIGSWVVRGLSGTDVPDAVSGFRAISQRAALQLNIVSSFSYTIEMLIQAGRKDLAIVSVPIRTNAPTRPSRLFRGMPSFIARSVATMARMYTMYRPLTTFVSIGAVLFVLGAMPIVRFLYFWLNGNSVGHVQSLVLGGVFVILGSVTFLVGLVADLINFNRQLVEITLEKVRRLEIDAP